MSIWKVYVGYICRPDYYVNLESICWVYMPTSVPIDEIFYSRSQILQIMHCFIWILGYDYMWFASTYMDLWLCMFASTWLNNGFWNIYYPTNFEFQFWVWSVWYAFVCDHTIYFYRDELVVTISTSSEINCFVVSCIDTTGYTTDDECERLS